MQTYLETKETAQKKASVKKKPTKWSTLLAYASIARPDHWIKNVFVLPGILLPLAVPALPLAHHLVVRIAVGLLATCLIASSNYVINEILDAPYDRMHPIKKNRPVPSGKVRLGPAYCEWILLNIAGLSTAALVSWKLTLVLLALWIMGCFYNIRPFRTKDVAYLDVLTESVNNPLRMLAGWYMVADHLVPTLSLLMAYWMIGCYFMALKRFSEYREFANPALAASYRASFGYYTERSLLASVMFYASASMLFIGAFTVRYRMELVLAFPFLALAMAIYLKLSFDAHSAIQNPEKLYREKHLMLSVLLCATAMISLLFINLPFLRAWFPPIYGIQ